jgi:hypothetical protein
MNASTVSTSNAGISDRPVAYGPIVRKSRRERPGKRPPPTSRDAQRSAVAILEVLAGIRTPAQAATALGVTLPRYYLWEQRAVDGLVRACEPRQAGKEVGDRHRIAVLEKELVRLRQACARQQALVRASQRTIGLAPPPQPAAKPAAKNAGKAAVKAGGAAKAKRKRRPVVRAMKAVATLRAASCPEGNPVDCSSADEGKVLQQSVPGDLPQTAASAPVAAALPEA